MNLLRKIQVVYALGCLGTFHLMVGCGGGSNSEPVSSAIPPATQAPSRPSAPDPAPQSGNSGEDDTEQSDATYGGEESSSQGPGGFAGNPQGFGPDGEDEGSSFGGFGGNSMGSSRPQVGGFGDAGGASRPQVGGFGRAGVGGPPSGGGPPPGSVGPPGPGVFPGTGGGGAARSGGFASGPDDDFGPDGSGFGGRSGGPSFGGPGVGFGPNAVGSNPAMVFVGQFCVSCHSANNMKGNVRFDNLTADIQASPDIWSAAMTVLEDQSMPPAEARQPDLNQRTAVIAFLREQLGSSAELTYIQQAELAFKRGEAERAQKLFYAHAIAVEDDEAAEVLDHFRLYRPKVNKPEDLVASNDFATTIKPGLMTQLNFAVGVVLDASPQVTDVKPIGTRQSGGAGAGGGDVGGFGGFGPGGPGAGSDSSKLIAFEDLTGDFGKTFVSAFEDRRKQGKHGSLFTDLPVNARPSDPAVGGAGAGANAGFGFGSSDGDEPGDFRGPGPGGPGLAGPGLGGPGLGGPGMRGPGMRGPGMGGPGMGGPGTSGPAKTMPDQRLANGLIYLGKGTLPELLKKAVEMGADGLFVFDIKSSKNNRSNIVTTDTRLRFLLSSGKVVAATPKALKNIDIERAIVQNKEPEDVQKHIDQIFIRLDDILAVEQVPPMPEAAALKYLHGQLHSGAEALEIMAQARLFQSRGIIGSDQLSTIYQIVLEGNEGVSLATGSEADRKLVLTTLMPDL